RSNGLDFELLEKVVTINEARPARMLQKLKDKLWVLNGKTIAVLGLAFKSNTDDVRETPAAKLIELLKEEGVHVKATDPMGIENFKRMYSDLAAGVSFCNHAEDALKNSHAAVILTDWEQYKELDWAYLKNEMEYAVILDT